MTKKAALFGSKCTLTEKFAKEIIKSGIAEMVMDLAKAKETSKMANKLAGKKN